MSEVGCVIRAVTRRLSMTVNIVMHRSKRETNWVSTCRIYINMNWKVSSVINVRTKVFHWNTFWIRTWKDIDCHRNICVWNVVKRFLARLVLSTIENTRIPMSDHLGVFYAQTGSKHVPLWIFINWFIPVSGGISVKSVQSDLPIAVVWGPINVSLE